MVSVSSAGFYHELMPEIPFSSSETSFMHGGYPEPEESVKNHVNSSSSNSDGQKPAKACIIDERRRRRMISNRDSARRSRMRKQRHLENLRKQVNRLRIENRVLMDRLRFVVHHCYRLRTENDLLLSEHIVLRQKLADIREAILLQQYMQLDLLHDHAMP